jgi:hypothetical protein
MSQYYKKLGKLPKECIQYFKTELLKKKTDKPYQWIWFDDNLNNYFLSIFANTNLKIQYDTEKNRRVQKAFYSDPGHGFRIHRDGLYCRSALNIAVSCNDDDWVRWYDDSVINNLNSEVIQMNTANGSSRNLDIIDYESVPYIEELHTETGDVYVLDVDRFHSFKCNGTEPRIIIQTKFDKFPLYKTLLKSLEYSSFNNLI